MMQDVYQPGDPVADILFNWLPVIGVVAVGVFGIIVMFIGFRVFVKAARLRKFGVEGHATVTEKWLKKGYVAREERHVTKPTKYHYIRYERSSGGRQYSEKEVAPVALWEQVQPGDEVQVIYHPTRSIMRLADWSHKIGHGAGAFQMGIGAVMTSVAVSMILAGIWNAVAGPDFHTKGDDWIAETAEVLSVNLPADPYLRVFAPTDRLVQVAFGDTQGGANLGNLRLVHLSGQQVAEGDLSRGTILNAWMDPANEFNAILDIERDPSVR